MFDFKFIDGNYSLVFLYYRNTNRLSKTTVNVVTYHMP